MSNEKLSTRVGVIWLLESKNLEIYSYKVKGFVKAINVSLQDPLGLAPNKSFILQKLGI